MTMNAYNSTQTAYLKEMGNYLQQQRMAKSLSIDDIASRTFISLAMLKALEEGNIEQLPELVYVQGFIRRYGEVLNLDGEALAKNIPTAEVITPENRQPQAVSAEQRQPITPATATQTLPSPKPPTSPTKQNKGKKTIGGAKKPQYLLYLLLLAGILGGGAYFFYARSTAEFAPQEAINPIESPSEAAIEAIEPSPVVDPSPATIPPPSPSPVATTSQTAPVSLTVQTKEKAWLRVDVDGKKDYEGILAQDSEQTWTGDQSINIRSGNAGAVQISVNQQPFTTFGNPGEVKEATFNADNEDNIEDSSTATGE